MEQPRNAADGSERGSPGGAASGASGGMPTRDGDATTQDRAEIIQQQEVQPDQQENQQPLTDGQLPPLEESPRAQQPPSQQQPPGDNQAMTTTTAIPPQFPPLHPMSTSTAMVPHLPPPPQFGLPPPPPPPVVPPPFMMDGQQQPSPMAMAQYYESQMRDHAVAYATAAAGAAWAQAQVAQAAAEFAYGHGGGKPFSSSSVSPDPSPPPGRNVSSSSSSLMNNHPPPMPPGPPPPPFWNPYNNSGNLQPPPPFQQQQPPYPSPWYPPQPETMPNPDDDLMQKGDHDSAGGSQPGGPYDNTRRHRARKRQQRLPPGHNNSSNRPSNLGGVPLVVGGGSMDHQNPTPTAGTSNSTTREKIRRRLRSDGDNSSSSGSSFMNHSQQPPKRVYHTRKKKARSDASLVGKTAVSALYEWCNKRQCIPVFTEETTTIPDMFEFRVSLVYQQPTGDGDDNNSSNVNSGEVLARGRGISKVGAKQLAARRALEVLLPGVQFDEASGFLIQLPPSAKDGTPVQQQRGGSDPEDLAPNLAKVTIKDKNMLDSSKKRPKSSSQQQQAKRPMDIYPGTSTDSEAEDENTFYTSRCGASVCSALLHAMVQIDDRIPGPPTWSYQVSPELPGTSNEKAQLKRKVSASNKTAVLVHRGTFTATGRLTVLSTSRTEPASAEAQVDGEDNIAAEYTSVLEASGVGSTKQGARHVAAARLLALLFPECKTMVEVKAAAEAKRERYAASKARKLQQQQEAAAEQRRRRSDPPGGSGLADLEAIARASTTDPSLPQHVLSDIKAILEAGTGSSASAEEGREGDESLPLGPLIIPQQESVLRQLSRQKQTDQQVEAALQCFNDPDEGRRSLPEELSADDVGRTVLRRAQAEDVPRIRNIFASTLDNNPKNAGTPGSVGDSAGTLLGPLSILKDDGEATSSQASQRLWSSSSIVLLLCRAIAAYEDPPLGCAVLTRGFSMADGKILRVAEIAHGQHLPQERFIECLENFAACMNCELEVNNDPPPFSQRGRGPLVVSEDGLRGILQSHVGGTAVPPVSRVASLPNRAEFERMRVSSPLLQSVREESEGSDDASSVEKRPAAKRASKQPSKRTRVE